MIPLAIMRMLIKGFVFVIVITCGAILSFVIRIVTLPLPQYHFININTKYIVRLLAKISLLILNVKVMQSGEFGGNNQVIVANHWGYLDALILMSTSNCLVVSNTDIKKTPIFGSIMSLMGFVFVDRIHHSSIPWVLKSITTKVTKGRTNISFFPEGVTNNGVQLRPFKSSFFQLISYTDFDCQPVVLRIISINGEKVSPDNIKKVVFNRHEMKLIKHIIKFLCEKSVVIKLDVLQPISQNIIKANQLTRKDICGMAEKQIGLHLTQNLDPGV